MNIPAELKYTKDHEWARIDGHIVTIGITDFAQGELGDVVFLDINTVGKEVAEGETFGTVEAVKTVSDLFMPVHGRVLEFNKNLDANPEKLNQDPYGEGWIIRIVPTDPSTLANLLSAKQYKDLLPS